MSSIAHERFRKSSPVCPWCDHTYPLDPEFYSQDTEKWNCESCGKAFCCTGYVNWTFTTRRVDSEGDLESR